MALRRWSPEEDQQLLDLRANGETYSGIGAAIGRPTGSVKTRARQIGAAAAPDRPWSEAEIEYVRKLRADGVRNPEIAARLERTNYSVAKCVSKLGRGRQYRPVAERFWAKVDRKEPDECWPWLGARDRKGYGAFMLPHPKRRATAPRVAYELENGPIPEGLAVMHKCDNPPCVNPAHLVAGTIADNNRDMVAKRRHWRLART